LAFYPSSTIISIPHHIFASCLQLSDSSDGTDSDASQAEEVPALIDDEADEMTDNNDLC
jgi:hypothetical protein